MTCRGQAERQQCSWNALLSERSSAISAAMYDVESSGAIGKCP